MLQQQQWEGMARWYVVAAKQYGKHQADAALTSWNKCHDQCGVPTPEGNARRVLTNASKKGMQAKGQQLELQMHMLFLRPWG